MWKSRFWLLGDRDWKLSPLEEVTQTLIWLKTLRDEVGGGQLDTY